MIKFFRSISQNRIVQILLFTPLIFSFGFLFQTSDFLHPHISDAVVEAGPREIGQEEFKKDFDRIKANVEQERNGGEPIPVEELVKVGMPQQVADELATQQAFGAWLAKANFKPSDKLLEKEIKDNKAFFNPTTGAFDRQQYLGLLSQNGLSEQRYMQQLTDDVATAHFNAGLFAGLHAPAIYTAVETTLQNEKRDASWFTFDQKATGTPPKPTDDQLKAFIKERNLLIPEVRTMTLVLFAPRTVMDQVKVDPAEVKKTYDFQKDALYTQAETRNFVQIQAANQADAAAIAQALKGGADPAAVAKSHNLKPLTYQNRPKSAVPDPAVGTAAFALKAGEVSAPVQGSFGWSVVKVSSITPGQSKSFDQVKADIEGKLKEKAAEAKADELAQKYQDLRDKGVSMADAAKQLGLTPLHYPPITKDGVLMNGQPIRTPTGQAFTFPKSVLQALYSTPKGGQIDSPEETGAPNEYFALHVDDDAPAHMLSLDDQTRPQLTQVWMQQAWGKLLQTKADELVARVQKGESFAAVAASVGAKVETRSDYGRITIPQQRDQLMAMMKSDPGAIILAQTSGLPLGKPVAVNCNPAAPCKAIVRIDAIHPPLPAVAAGDVLKYQQVANRLLAQGFSQTVQKHAKAEMKAKTDKQRLMTAIGAQQEGQAPAKGR